MNPVATALAKGIEAKVSKVKWETAKIKRRNHYLAAQGVKDSLRFIVTRARTKELIRKKNAVSKPGGRPVVHTKRALSRMGFNYSYKDLTGVAGPVKIPDRDPFVRNAVTAPNALEYGGQYTIQEHWQQFGFSKEGRWVRTTKRTSGEAKKSRRRKRKITIQPRPFMKPALEHEMAVGNVINSFKDKWSV